MYLFIGICIGIILGLIIAGLRIRYLDTEIAKY